MPDAPKRLGWDCHKSGELRLEAPQDGRSWIALLVGLPHLLKVSAISHLIETTREGFDGFVH